MDTTVEKRADKDNEDVKIKSVKSHKRKRKQHVVTVDTSRAGDSTIGALKPCMARLGLKQVKGDCDFQVPQGQNTRHCDIHWQVVFRRDHDSKHGIHNKFPGMSEICGKMSLSRTLDFLQDLFPEEFDFYPKTWYLPVQYEKFQSDVEKLPKRRRSKNIHVYIVKPDTGSKGEGIFLIHNPKEYRNFGNQSHVVQEYMSNVYIIDGFKFDLRIYAVIKSLEPLEFYICTEGLARFSTVLYRKPNVKNLKDSFMHLTNYSLNKRSSGFDRSENEDEGSKRTLTSVFNRLEQDGHDTVQVWDNIEKVVCKTILALVPEMKIQYRAVTPPKEKGPSCFQIVGLDILLLDDLTPVLMEVNSKPSLSINSEKEVSPGIVEHVPSPKDKEVKLPLITDTIRLIIPPHRLEFCLERRRRLLARRNKVTEKNQLSNDENRNQGHGHDVVTLISEINVENKENKPEGIGEICGKMSLSRTLDFLQDLFPEEFDFYPKTWYLPVQYEKFQSDVEKLPKRRRSKNIPVYIVKPDTGSMGEGIFLIRSPREYRNFSNRSHVVQEYMSSVYIIDGFKFDFRIYAVIKSLEPLEFYICTEGLARFSTVPYKKPNIKNLQESFMHLTNYSLNKRSSGFDRSENEDEGSKRTLTSVFNRLEQDGHDTGQVWENIEKVVCKTILALVPEMKIQYRAVTPPKGKGPSCFQIIGLDILLLDDLTPVLLEVNSSPSLMIDSEQEVSPGVMEHLPSPKDEEIKLPLITDTFRLVIPPHRLEFW
ncbi:hypothetical protein FSP39_012927 [Pinctada imbricata]|uniref:Tubulin polyglutamylase TTLL11 n=1 Tax=Pinctada imbricata TaxID=66713 RepID=A0AA88XM48_PINIB|nr:hypothetical protein FSP39_012927 [Pinctada imbricata]